MALSDGRVHESILVPRRFRYPFLDPTVAGFDGMIAAVGRVTRTYACTMSANREKWPWNATVTVRVGPLRCLATMRSASPARGLSRS